MLTGLSRYMKILGLLAVILTGFTVSTKPPVAAAAPGGTPPLSVTAVHKADFGVNVFSYDQQLASPGTPQALRDLGVGLQQFPNANTWSWASNRFHPGGGPAPVSLDDWGSVLSSTGSQGLFIFNYDENPTWTGGGSAADAAKLTEYIRRQGLPIDAIVIGSEEYGAWDFAANLNPVKTAAYYGQQADAIAKAIHGVDPKMRVGVVFDPGQSTADRDWNQTVLRLTAADIDFVSVHSYPVTQSLGDADLLKELPRDIAGTMDYVKDELARNVPPGRLRKIGIWVTEFNPYSHPTVQSTEPVYGAVLVESLIAWKAFGADRVVIWSFDGQAHQAGPDWPLASARDSRYGIFALVGDGEAPEVGTNGFYPSAEALAEFMRGLGSGGKLSAWIGDGLVVGQVAPQGLPPVAGGGGSQAFIINQSAAAQTIRINGQAVSLPPTALTVLSLPAPIESLASFTTAAYADGSQAASYVGVTPQLTGGPSTVYPGETATVSGTGLGTGDGYVVIKQQDIEYGAPDNAYKVQVLSWAPSSVSFRVPDGYSGPGLQAGEAASFRLVTSGLMLSPAEPLSVSPPPGVSLITPTILGVTAVGETVTITGRGFGSEPPLKPAAGGGMDQAELEIHDAANNSNYGYDGSEVNWYGVNIGQWSDGKIVLTFGPIPPGTGDGLEIRFLDSGQVVARQETAVTASPQEGGGGTSSLAPTITGATSVGETVTITGRGFGSEPALKPAAGGGMDQAELEIHDAANNSNYGYDGSEVNWYGVNIGQWSDGKIVLTFGPIPPGTGDGLEIRFWGGGSVLSKLEITLKPQ